jgi:DNA-binding XRE family transcriptional regulator
MAYAIQAREFLAGKGAKKVNPYLRGGIISLRFNYKGEACSLDLEPGDNDTGAQALPKLREILGAIDKSKALVPIRTTKDTSTAGARLKVAREHVSNMTRARLATEAGNGITVELLKFAEDALLVDLTDTFSIDQIVAMANVCLQDPNWLAGKEIVAPPEPVPEEPEPIPHVAVATADMLVLLATPIQPEDYPVIGARIREARTRATPRISQQTIADLLQVTGVSVGNLEKGKSSTLWAELPTIAEGLGVTVYWLRTGSDVPVVASEPPVPEPPAPEPADAPIEASGDEPAPVSPDLLAKHVAGQKIRVPDGLDFAGIGGRVRQARQHIRMGQEDLGERIGYVGTTIVNMEKGRKNGAFAMLPQLGHHLRVSADWLRTGEGQGPTRLLAPPPVAPSNLRTTRALVPVAPPAPPPVLVVDGKAIEVTVVPPRARGRPTPKTPEILDEATLQALIKFVDGRMDQAAEAQRLRHAQITTKLDEHSNLLRTIAARLKEPTPESPDVLGEIVTLIKSVLARMEQFELEWLDRATTPDPPAPEPVLVKGKSQRRIDAGKRAWRKRCENMGLDPDNTRRADLFAAEKAAKTRVLAAAD